MEHQRILIKVIATDSTDTVGIAADPKGPVVVATDLNDPTVVATELVAVTAAVVAMQAVDMLIWKMQFDAKSINIYKQVQHKTTLNLFEKAIAPYLNKFKPVQM